MNNKTSTNRYRPGLHVHLYFWLALVTASLVPFLLLSGWIYDTNHVSQGATAFIVMVIAFQCLLWQARLRCSSSELGVWDGWLYVTGSMSIGVGGLSLVIAVPCAAFAILATAGITLASFVDNSPVRAQYRFQRMVSWFIRHRMYQ